MEKLTKRKERRKEGVVTCYDSAEWFGLPIGTSALWQLAKFVDSQPIFGQTTTIRGRPGPFGLAVTYGAEIEIRPVLPFFRIIETINTSKSGRTCYSMSKVLELQKYQALDFSSRLFLQNVWSLCMISRYNKMINKHFYKDVLYYLASFWSFFFSFLLPLTFMN